MACVLPNVSKKY